MITVKFDYKQGKIASFTMNGHANFAKHGSDIVCAGASAVSFGTVNSIISLTDVEPIIDTNGDGGYLRCEIPADLSADTQDKVQLLLEAMLVSLQTIQRDYGKYIKINLNK
ncbi:MULTISPECIES: ribosomal-processing cysteine protease Prp [Bacillus]|uniref:ribosomal-processing cysteine protease Prp n=1 Tax=Bacillus TaxID=1386 RepID=UPI0003120F3A|nr:MULTISPECIES: ribosomal-processing cysteine protease Prp [Bacillus]